MELIEDHINTHLTNFIELDNNDIFNCAFESLSSTNKNDLRSLLLQIYRVIELSYNDSNNGLNTLHVHFANEFEKQTKILIAEFLWNVCYKKIFANDNSSNENEDLISKIEEIENILGRDVIAPSSNDRREFNRIINFRKKLRKILSFYKTLPKTVSLSPKTLINIKINQESELSLCFEDNPFYLNVQSLEKVNSYVLTNVESFSSISKVKLADIPIFKIIENIILFDCEDRIQRFNQFNAQNLENLNQRHGTKFKNFMLITFGKNCSSINTIRNKIESVKDRYKIPSNSSYTILNSEIESLISNKKSSYTKIDFLGVEKSSFWDTFLVEASFRNLYELRSIKLMNVYSICFSSEIKNYILDEIFSNKEYSELITSSTKSAILEFSDDSIKELKESLSLSLDLIINSEIKKIIAESLENVTSIFVDDSIFTNVKLKLYIEKALGVGRSIKIKGWSGFSKAESTKPLFLSYRDQGKYPNYFYPNLLEIQFQENLCAVTILPKLFFFNNYKWAKFNLYKDYHKYLSHPIRESHFNWARLSKIILNEKPENEIFNFNWILENEYFSSDSRETYKVKLLNHKSKSYHGSDLIIYSENHSGRLRIERLKWFYENIDFNENKYNIQKLDELLDEFNPAEKLIDTSQQDLELEIIRKQLGLTNESAGKIWKVLLKKKSEVLGIDNLYKELKQIFTNNNIPLVRESYFINSWLNTESDSLMPRGNKVVKVIFHYLKLSNNYRLILYRLKNASISGKIEATRKYSSLLKDLFTDGCFDLGVFLESLLENKILHYQKDHFLEELGIDNENPQNGLITLIDLIQPELKLLELETIEKLNNE